MTNDPESIARARDRQLRRRILRTLYDARGSPSGWINAGVILGILRSISSGGSDATDDHFISLVRDLVAKNYAEEKPLTRRSWQRFDAQFLDLKITAHGISLVNQTAPADPDIEDDRI